MKKRAKHHNRNTVTHQAQSEKGKRRGRSKRKPRSDKRFAFYDFWFFEQEGKKERHATEFFPILLDYLPFSGKSICSPNTNPDLAKTNNS